jgi:hypothetical protein
MTRHHPGFAVLIATLVLCASKSLSAQTAAPVQFDLTLEVPVQLSDLHPDIVYFNLTCSVQPVGATGSDGLVSNLGMGYVISGGTYKGTREGHFTITSQHGYPPGQQWKYSCSIFNFLKRAEGGSPQATATPGNDWALVGSGSPKIEGTFTTQ